MKKIIHLSLIILSTVFFSCKPMQPISVSKAEGINITKSDDKKVEVEISMRIKNPNKMGFNVYKSEVDVTVNGQALGKAKLKKKIHVAGNSDDVHVFVLETDLSKILSGGISAISTFFTSRSVTLGAKGDIHAGKFLYRKTFPIDVKEKIPLGNK